MACRTAPCVAGVAFMTLSQSTAHASSKHLHQIMNVFVDSRLPLARRQCLRLAICCCALAFAAAGSAFAAALTWSGTTSGNWNVGTNWAGTAPVNGDTLTFTGIANTSTTNNLTGLTVGTGTGTAISFNNSTTAGVFTLAGNAITLAGDIVSTGTTGTPTHTISLDLILNGTRTLNAATSNNINISGLISQTGGAQGLTKSGGGTSVLSNDNNSFTGALSVSLGTLTVTSIAASGTNSAAGAGSAINIGSGATNAGVLNINGSATTAVTVNRSLTLAATTTGAATFSNNNANAGGAIIFTGTVSNAGTGAKNFTIGGTNTGANDFQSVIGNGSGTLTVAKTGVGTWTFSGTNTFTGSLLINSGTLNLATLTNAGVASNAGAGSIIRIGATTTNGTLNYTGAAANTNRTVTIGNNSTTPATSDTGGAAINNNGTGALVFTAANFNTTGLTGSVATSRTLTLGGSNTGANEIQGVIADGLSGTMATAVTKADAGSWTLSGANTYTGATTISAGTLTLSGSNSSGGTTTLSGGTLRLNSTSNGGLAGGTLTLTSGSLVPLGASRSLSNAVTLTAVSVSGAQDLSISGTLTATGAADRTLTNNLNSDKTLTLANVQISDNASSRTLSIAGSGNTTVSGVISNGTATSGALSLTGSGTLTLSGANTYTGGTVVAGGGTLKLGDANVIPDTGTLTIGGTAATGTLDMNGFSDSVGSLVIARSTSTVAGLSHSIVNTGGGSSVLTLGGAITYNAGSAGFENGSSTIAVGVDLGGAQRNVTINDSPNANVELEISGVVSSSVGGITKLGAGTLRLSNTANSFPGQVSIDAGTLQVSSLANAGTNSGLGAGSGTAFIRMGNSLTGTLEYIGSASSRTDRQVQIGLAGNNNSIGATILNNGTGTVTFTGSGGNFISAIGTTTAPRTLTLGGSNTGANTISGVIRDNLVSSATISLVKQDAGTWVLAGDNTYSGGTSVNTGTLEVNNSSGSGTGSGSVTISNGTTLKGDGSITSGSGSFVFLNGSMLVGATGSTAGSDFSITTSGSGSTLFGAASVLNLDLWSTTGSNQAATLAAADMLRLFGSIDITSGALLTLSNPNALTFQAGDVFRLFDWSGRTTHTGAFIEDFSGVTLGSGLMIDTSDLYTGGTISILSVPEPSRALLLVAGGVSLLARRRRFAKPC